MVAEIPGLQSRRIDTEDGRLHAYRLGETGAPVLLLSGAGIDNALLSWRHLIPVLGESHRAIALDWPKQGRSRPWNGVADHPRMLRCVTETLDAFEIDRAHLVGLSQGGALALATAIEHPDRVDRVVALAPGGIISFPPIVHQLLWLTARSRLLNETLPRRMFRTREQITRFLRASLFAAPVDDFEDVVDEIMEEARHGVGASDWQKHSIGPWRMKVDLRPRLHEITAPTLFIQGDRDKGVRPKHTIRAAGLVPGARLEMLEGHGHWTNRQSPEIVNRMIVDFLAEGPESAEPGRPA